MRRTPIKTGTQLIFPVLRIGDFFCVFLRYQIVINCVFLSHLLIAGCDIGVQISVRPYVRPFVRPSTFTSKFSFLDISDSCESETLHINCH